jgi:hypothetical protein
MAPNKNLIALRNEWLKSIAADTRLKVTAVRVAIVIALEYLNRKTGTAWPSYETLAAAIGTNHKKTAVRAVDDLVKAGYLAVTIRGKMGRGKSNNYAPVFGPIKGVCPDTLLNQEKVSAQTPFSESEKVSARSQKRCPPGHLTTGNNPVTPNPLVSDIGEGGADSAPPVPGDGDAEEVATIAAELLASLPTRPDSTPSPSRAFRREVARAIGRGATREELTAGAARYRAYATLRWGAGPYCHALSPTAFVRDDKWLASWEAPGGKPRKPSRDQAADRAALLAEIRGEPPASFHPDAEASE